MSKSICKVGRNNSTFNFPSDAALYIVGHARVLIAAATISDFGNRCPHARLRYNKSAHRK